jgi:hypothetical protein
VLGEFVSKDIGNELESVASRRWRQLSINIRGYLVCKTEQTLVVEFHIRELIHFALIQRHFGALLRKASVLPTRQGKSLGLPWESTKF